MDIAWIAAAAALWALVAGMVVGLDRLAGTGRVAGTAPAPATGSARMIGTDVLYGLGGLVALSLFAYLVFALLRAEEF